MEKTTYSKLSGDRELKNVLDQISTGLGLYQGWSLEKKNFWIALPLLCAGLERFQKMTLQLIEYDNTSSFHPVSYMRKLGHDQTRLNALILESRQDVERRTPATLEDRRFLESDALLQEILIFMSKFGANDRYFFLDGVGDPQSEFYDPWYAWQEIEAKSIPTLAAYDLNTENDYKRWRNAAVSRVVACIEKMIRAYARMVVHLRVGQAALQLTAWFGTYINLRDEDLGKTPYPIGSE